MNGFAPLPGRPQNAPGDIAVPGENGVKGAMTCRMWSYIPAAGAPAPGGRFASPAISAVPGAAGEGRPGEGWGRKVKEGMEGVIGGRPCGVIIGMPMPIIGWCSGLIGCPCMCGEAA